MPHTDEGLPYVGQETSREAAEAAAEFADSKRKRVANAIHTHTTSPFKPQYDPGITDQEGQGITGIGPQTYTPRRKELSDRGLVEDSGKTRRTRSGCRAIVWVSTVRMTQDVLDTGSVKDIAKLGLFRR